MLPSSQANEVDLVQPSQEPRQLAHVFGQSRHGQGAGTVGIDDEPILALFFHGWSHGPATIAPELLLLPVVVIPPLVHGGT